MFIDTHAHLYLDQFSEDIAAVIDRAQDSGLQKIFLPNIDCSTTASMNAVSEKFPGFLQPLMGLHPCSVKEDYEGELKQMKKELETGNYFGVGETGIDLYWDKSFKEQQIEAFEIQIDWAKEYDLPIIIHSREALDITIELITKHQDGSLTGVFHCFNGDVEQCKKIEDVGFHMGLGGVVTYKKAAMQEVVAKMNIDHMVLETDAPYLSPVPYRGKRNESSYLLDIAKKVAEFRNESLERIGEHTSNNAKTLFKKAFYKQA